MFLGAVSSISKKKESAEKKDLKAVLHKVLENGGFKKNASLPDEKVIDINSRMSSNPRVQERVKLPRLPLYDDQVQSAER